MNKTELKALIKEAFLAEKKNILLNENAPGFDNRKQGEALPTLESVKAAYEAKKLAENEETVEEITTVTKMTKPAEAAEIAKAEGTPKATVDAAIKKAKTSGKDVSIAEDTLEEDKFVDAALEDLRTVIDNLAHTTGMGKEEAAEMAMMHIEDMFIGGEEDEEEPNKALKPAAERYNEAVNEIALPSATAVKANAEIRSAPTMAKVLLQMYKQLQGGEQTDFSTNSDFKVVLSKLEKLASQVKGPSQAKGDVAKSINEEEGMPTVLDDKSMDDLLNIMLKYVKDPADAEKELERFDSGGFDALSDELQANLDRDEEYKAWYNELHSIKDYWADYTDIGMFYVEGSEEEKSLTDNEFEELGKKIVKQLYAGDVKKAYDDIVRGEKRGTVADINEETINESVIAEADKIVEAFKK